jgi:membrane protein YqaA with SNARE-associated domain
VICVLGEFILWVQAFVQAYGLAGAFVIAVLESFIFPVPTATFIAPFTAMGIDPAAIILVATSGSLIGAVIGYALGLKLGRPVAERLFKKHIPRVEKWYDRWGVWAVFIAAFSPIPFKVFTWTSGIFELDFKRFLLASLTGRLLQFTIAAYVGYFLGPGVIDWLMGF